MLIKGNLQNWWPLKKIELNLLYKVRSCWTFDIYYSYSVSKNWIFLSTCYGQESTIINFHHMRVQLLVLYLKIVVFVKLMVQVHLTITILILYLRIECSYQLVMVNNPLLLLSPYELALPCFVSKDCGSCQAHSSSPNN